MNITALKKDKFLSKGTEIPEINFLKESNLNLTLNQGFVELYRVKPENPVLFLGKFLKKEAKSYELLLKYREEEKKREKLQNKFIIQEKSREIVVQKDAEKKKVFADQKEALKKQIEECPDFWNNFNNICDALKKIINATGVYVSWYDWKRKNITEEDDENGHIHPSNTKVIRYIGWCEDHSFWHGKFWDPNQGITYSWINPNLEPVAQDADGQQNNEGNAQNVGEGDGQIKKENVVKEGDIKYKLVEEVVNEPKIWFFREPRLGCYLALDITYKTSLSYASLLSAIEANKEYNENKAKQEERYKEWKDNRENIEKEIEDIKREQEEAHKRQMEQHDEKQLTEGGEASQQKHTEQAPQQLPVDPTAGQNSDLAQLQAQLTEWTEEPVKMREYVKEEKKIILCIDTLGQDRVFSAEEMEYIQWIAKTIKTSIESLEQKWLEKDRDIRIKFCEDENAIKADENFGDEKYEANIQAAINSYYATEEFKSKNITDEAIKAAKGDIAKSKYLQGVVLKGAVLNVLTTFSQFEFVEQNKIFQNIFYFAHTDPLFINESETNKLEWKKARSYWKNVFSYIIGYNPIGPKPEQVKGIYKLNKIKDNLESAIRIRNEVQDYSFTLLLLVDYLLLLIKIRHHDIVTRTNNVMMKKEEREKIILKNKEIDEERNKIIEQMKAWHPTVDKQEPGAEGQHPVEGQSQQQDPQQVQPAGEGQPTSEISGEAFNWEEVLKKFDEEHPKSEVPEDVEYDLDLDYDI